MGPERDTERERQLRLDRIGRLAAVAQGLEREGAYNGAKLLRAVLDQELIRHAAADAPSGGRAVAAAVDALREDLGDHLPAEIAALLPHVAACVRDGRPIPLTEAPPVRVCRACGELFLGGEPPATCPVCEAPPLSFRELLPIWFLEPAAPEELVGALETNRQQVLAALAERSDEELGRQPAPGEWSVRQTLEHLLFAEQLFAERVDRLLTEDRPDLTARAVWAETPASDEGSVVTDLPAQRLASELTDLRSATITRLRGLPAEAWQRRGHHPEWGEVTVLTQTAYFARHLASHLAQLVAAADGRLPGR